MSWKVGLRIVDLGELARQMYCTDCSSILDLNSTEREVEVGLASVLKIMCQCGRDNHVRTGTLTPQAQRASSFPTQVTQTSADDLMSFDINAKVYTEILAYQRGEKTVLHFLAVLNIPASLLTTAHRSHHSEPLLWHKAQGDTATSDASSATVVKHNTMQPVSLTITPDPSVSTTVVTHNTVQPASLTLTPDPSVSTTVTHNTMQPASLTLTPDPSVSTTVVTHNTMQPASLTLTPDPSVSTTVATHTTMQPASLTLSPDPSVSTTVVTHNTIQPASLTLTPDPSVSTTVVTHNTMQPAPLTLTPDPSVSTTVVTHNTVQPASLTLTPDPSVSTTVVTHNTMQPAPLTLTPDPSVSTTVVKHNTVQPVSLTLTPDPSVSTTVVTHNTVQPASLTLTPDPSVSTTVVKHNNSSTLIPHPSVSASASQDGSPSRKRRRKVTCDESIQSVKNPKSCDFTDESVEYSLHLLATNATVRDVKDDFSLAGLQKSQQVEKLETGGEGAVFVSTTGETDLKIEQSVCIKCETENVCENNGADTPPVASEAISPPTHRRTRSSRLCKLQNQHSADNSRTKKNSPASKKKAVDINKSTDKTQDASRDSSTSSPKTRTSSDRNSLASGGQRASRGQQTVKSTAGHQGSSGQEETDRSVPAVTSVTSSRLRPNKKQKFTGNSERDSARGCVGRRPRSRGGKKTASKPRSLQTESRLQCRISERHAEMGVNRKDTRPQSEGADRCIADHGQPQPDRQESGASNNTQPPVSHANQAGPPSVTKPRSRAMVAQNMQKAAYHCSQCKALFESSREYTDHMRQRHSVTHPHQCGRCSQSFPTQHQLKRHRRQHSAVEEHHECTVCLKVFPTGRRLRAHRTTHTKQERFQPLKRYRCQVCGEEFAKNYFLQIHLNHHRGKKPYQCFLCEEAFFSKPERRAHYKKCVAKTQSYLCELCGGRFGSVSSLRKHERVHSGEKPHRCRFCDKTFSRTNTLQIHERQHTGETPYVCDQCGCGFKQRVSLVTHMKSKHSVIATYYSQPRTGPRFTHLDYLSGKAFTSNSHPDSTSSDNVNSSSDGDPAANLTQNRADTLQAFSDAGMTQNRPDTLQTFSDAGMTQNRADTLQAFCDADMNVPPVPKSLLMSNTEDQTTAMTYANVEGSEELTDHAASSLIPYVVSGHGNEDGMATLAHAATVVALATNHTHTPVCPQGFHAMPQHTALAPAQYTALASTRQSALVSVEHAPLASTLHTALPCVQQSVLTSTQHTALTCSTVQHAPLASAQHATHQSVLASAQHPAIASVEHAAIACTQHPVLALTQHTAVASTQRSELTPTVHSADDISAGFTPVGKVVSLSRPVAVHSASSVVGTTPTVGVNVHFWTGQADLKPASNCPDLHVGAAESAGKASQGQGHGLGFTDLHHARERIHVGDTQAGDTGNLLGQSGCLLINTAGAVFSPQSNRGLELNTVSNRTISNRGLELGTRLERVDSNRGLELDTQSEMADQSNGRSESSVLPITQVNREREENTYSGGDVVNTEAEQVAHVSGSGDLQLNLRT